MGQSPAKTRSDDSSQTSCPVKLGRRGTDLGICFLLAALTLAVFGQTLRFGFVNYDDNVYVYENPVVSRGLTLKGCEWAFTHVVDNNWHPLTVMSHMLDCRIYGLDAGGHHLTNVLLHTASVLCLFLVLRRMTGVRWGSAFVAAVYAIHPLHVESVAWVAERKDVLSGLFFMLTLWAYERYARHPFSRGRYLLVAFLFMLGLLSKPMLVTLPFVLLLLDYWPLRRFTPPVPAEAVAGNTGQASKRLSLSARLIIEKIPLLALSGTACAATLLAQKDIIVHVPLALRIDNALVSCVVYLGQMFCPAGLAVLYPYPRSGYPFWETALACLLLASISTGVFLWRQKHPCWFIGWLWYLGMLVPVIGLVQVGMQARADRYTYLPQIGLYLALTWAAGNLCSGWRWRHAVRGAAAAAILAALGAVSFIQASYWRNSESLWTHALTCTSDNALAHTNLGIALFEKGQVEAAIAQYQQALQIQPDDPLARINLGNAFFKQGQVEAAVVQYQQALKSRPDDALAQYNLGKILVQEGQVEEAIAHYQRSLELEPQNVFVHNSLGVAFVKIGRVDEGVAQFQEAVKIEPENVDAQNNLGTFYLQNGQVDEAIAHLGRSLEMEPDNAKIQAHLGDALFMKGQVDDAITHYQRSLAISPDNPDVQASLGYAFFMEGQADEAITHYQTALSIRPDDANTEANLGNALLKQRQLTEAIDHYRKALERIPNNIYLLNLLARIQAASPDPSIRNGAEAVELARRANRLSGAKNPGIIATLAAAEAEAGQFPEAVRTARQAFELASAQTNTALTKILQTQIGLYQANMPFRDPSLTNAPPRREVR